MTVQPTSPLRRRLVWIVAAVIAVVLVAAGVGWRMHAEHAIKIGDRFDGVTVFSGQAATTERIRVPIAFGSLTVNLSAAGEIGERDGRVKAPDGATLMEVSWSPVSSYGTPVVWPRASARERRDPGTELTLITGGRRYPIASNVTISDERASAVVAVKGDGTDARVETKIGGRTFASTAGSLDPRVPRPAGSSACDDTAKSVYSWVTCSLPVYRAGYVAGLGAAPSGREWLVVSRASATREQREVNVYGDGEAYAQYLPSGPPKVSLTVDGVTAKPRIAGEDKVIGDSVQVAARAWLVDADRSSEVQLRYRLPTKIDRARSEWRGAPVTHEVDVSTTATYSAA